MKNTQLQIRISDELKEKAKQLAEEDSNRSCYHKTSKGDS